MGLQKKLNRRLIKRAIGSEYVYKVEAEERIKNGYSDEDEDKTSTLKSFIQGGVNEMKKEVKKKLGE